jgi:hypothetical protein
MRFHCFFSVKSPTKLRFVLSNKRGSKPSTVMYQFGGISVFDTAQFAAKKIISLFPFDGKS